MVLPLVYRFDKSAALIAHRSNLEGLARSAHFLSYALNNLLSVGQGNVRLLRSVLKEPKLQAIANDALGSYGGVELLSHNMAAVSYSKPFREEVVDVGELLKTHVEMFKVQHDGGDWIGLNVADSVPAILTDRNFLAIALDVLVSSGQELLSPDGSMDIACGAYAAPSGGGADALSRNAVSITVRYTGLKENVANPDRFFSTSFKKGLAQQPNVGLWFVKEFVLASAGEVRFEPTGSGNRAKLTVTMLFRRAARAARARIA